MSAVSPARRAAAFVVRSVSRGRRLDRALDALGGRLPERDRRWVHELAYGTVRLRGRLDYLLDLHLRKGISSLSPLMLDLLRQGSYQVLYMSGVPAYAAIDQTVTQVREVAGSGGARLANGVLRSIEREGGDQVRFPPLESDPGLHLSTWGSHPRWMVDRWLVRWSPQEVARLVESNNTQPPLFLRPLGLSTREAAALLEKAGYGCRALQEGLPCLRLEDGTNPALLLERVPGIVQDPGAALVTVYADPPPGRPVTDLCAAPGGKALALAGEGAYVLAADRSRPRLGVLKENLARIGGRVEVLRADARVPPFEEAAFVLLDVPCSGTGTLRRHPDARWRLEPGSVSSLAGLQAEMLEAASALVPPGGHLVYATCTLEPEENEEQVNTFLARHSGFEVQVTSTAASDYVDEDGLLRVLPQVTGFDGAFAARLVRTS